SLDETRQRLKTNLFRTVCRRCQLYPSTRHRVWPGRAARVVGHRLDTVPTPTLNAVGGPRPGPHTPASSSPVFSLLAAVLGFFVITLDAVAVNVALPPIRHDLGGGVTGLQWVLDGYTLMFAALLLSGGALCDRLGARRAFAAGLMVFVVASATCGLAH